MIIPFQYNDFYNELKVDLPSSTCSKRKIWAEFIIANNIDIKVLSELLKCEKKIATRFAWLLSDIGEVDSNKLHSQLPYLFKLRKKINHFNFKESFANYWRITGVPTINESEAIDLLFHWLLDAKVNVTIKSRSIEILLELSKKYPELTNELKICLIDQMHKYSKDFEKKIVKTLMKIENN